MGMNAGSRGFRNAFRNPVRTISIVVILGLSIGLALVMLIAHQAVGDKIDSVKQSIGNTVTIRAAGFSGGGDASNGLSTSQLDKVKNLAHITRFTETLNSRMTTTGTTDTPPGAFKFGGGSEGETSLVSPVKLNVNKPGGSGPGIFISGGGTLPTNFSLPISLTGTTNPVGTMDSGDTPTVTSGTAIDGTKDTDQAMISEAMASKNNLKVGSTFTAYNTTITVAAIFKTSTQAGDNVVIMSLPAVQRLTGNANAVQTAIATVDSITNIDSVTSAITKQLGDNADVTNSKESVEDAIKPLTDIQRVSLYSLIGALIGGACIILLTMIMIVRERKREIGVIKAIGGSNVRIMLQFMAEALTLTILSLIIGLIIGVIGGSPTTHTLVNNSDNNSSLPTPGMMTTKAGFASGGTVKAVGGPGLTVFKNDTIAGIHDVKAKIGWSVFAYGLGATLLIAATGSAVASFFIAKVRPAEVLRGE